MKNKAIFLDRDGILIEDFGYPHKPEHLKIKLEIIPHLQKAQKLGYLLIIVTNQAGIAKGIFSLEQYHSFQEHLVSQLRQRAIHITASYFCPFHKNGIIPPYNRDSPDRKPAPGMLLKAQEDYNIDFNQSYMIGDKFSDNIPLVKSFILESAYTKGEGETWKNFDLIFDRIFKGD